MIRIVLSALLVAGFAIADNSLQLGDVENCDTAQLDDCRRKIPKTRVGLPRNKEELDKHCGAYQIGMSCMDAWMSRCLSGDKQKIIHQQIGGARMLMRYLCANDTALRKEFLKEPQCLKRVSTGWTQCVEELRDAVKEINDLTEQNVYFNRNSELCCARDDYLMCVGDLSSVCSLAASTLLKRIAFVLANDVVACSQPPKTYCSAPPPAVTAPVLTLLYGIIFYTPRL